MSLEHHTRGPHKIRTGSEHTLLHRASWKPDERGRIVATLDDYTVVRDLVADLISEGVEVTVPPIVREAVEAVEKLIEVDD